MTRSSDATFDIPVLVVDDDEFFRMAVSKVLRERLGVRRLVVCAGAEEAVVRLSRGDEFGLALVDLNLPGVENREFLERLKSLCPELRLVVVSGSRSRDDVLMSLSAGAYGFVHKGMGIDELESALRGILSGAIYVPPFMTQTGQSPASVQADDAGAAELGELDSLTPRQNEVLHLLVKGHSNKGIARALDVSQGTVKFHLSAVFRVLGAQNRVEAAMIGARRLREQALADRSPPG